MASVVWPGRSCPCGGYEGGWRLFPLHVERRRRGSVAGPSGVDVRPRAVCGALQAAGRAFPLPPLPVTRQRPATTARPRQIDLFAEAPGKAAPTWRELPEEARVLLTNLMARLILDHACVDGAAPSKEVNDDL